MAPVGHPSQRLARLAQHVLAQRAAPTPSAASADDDTLALRPVHGLTTADFVQGSAGNTQTEEGIVLSEEERAVGALVAAMEAGIEDFDTAPLYSAGVDEQRLGLALARWREAGHALPRVWTKAGTLVRQEADTALPVPPDAARDAGGRTLVSDYSAEGARLSFAESVARLGLDPSATKGPTLAGLRIHDCPTDQVDIALSSDGMLAGLRELRSEGKIGHVSLGMNANLVAADILRLVRGAPAGTFDTLLLAGGYNLLCQDGAPVMVEAARRGAVIHNAGSLASGLLAGGFTYAYEKAPPEMVALRDRWAALAQRHSVALPAVAFAFAHAPAVVAKLVIGAASGKQLAENMRWGAEAAEVPAALWAEARAEGLLPEGVPCPGD